MSDIGANSVKHTKTMGYDESKKQETKDEVNDPLVIPDAKVNDPSSDNKSDPNGPGNSQNSEMNGQNSALVKPRLRLSFHKIADILDALPDEIKLDDEVV